MRWLKILTVAVVLGLVAQHFVRTRIMAPRPPLDAEPGQERADLGDALVEVASGLEVPWEIAFLPGGDLLVTERPGRLVRLRRDGSRVWSVEVPDVRHWGEGGLMGLALDPGFRDNRHIYLYLTTNTENRIERWTLGAGGELTDRQVLVEHIGASGHHDGGRLAFGPDSLLYATTGDVGHEEYARDPEHLEGKILRIGRDGGIPEDNPFGNEVYSVGHRNPQGLAWDGRGRLWSTEHGRSGFRTGLDEVNRIEPGADYGWPDFEGDARGEGVVRPVFHSGEASTWAPGSAAWRDGRLWFGGLRGEALYELHFREGRTAPLLTVHLFRDLGRIRTVRIGPGGDLWILTSNRDGRGSVRDGDDHIYRVDPRRLQ